MYLKGTDSQHGTRTERTLRKLETLTGEGKKTSSNTRLQKSMRHDTHLSGSCRSVRGALREVVSRQGMISIRRLQGFAITHPDPQESSVVLVVLRDSQINQRLDGPARPCGSLITETVTRRTGRRMPGFDVL